jgi:filamentous hemagglutinin
MAGGMQMGNDGVRPTQLPTVHPTVSEIRLGGGANNAGAGSLTDGTFAQVKARPNKPFSEIGQDKYSDLAGEPIETVQDLTNAINAGKIDPVDITVDFVMVNGQPVIANTRTSTALTNAGVPQSQWNGVNQTGQVQFGNQTFDQAVQNQLNNNFGEPISPSDW